MKNKLIDLNNHLFAQLERLSDEDIKGDALSAEIDRSKAVACIAKNVIENARLALDAQIAMRDIPDLIPPEMIGNDVEQQPRGVSKK